MKIIKKMIGILNMKKTLTSALICSAIALTAADNLLKNGSFEDMNAKGQLKAWYPSNGTKVITDAADGKQAIHLNNSRIASAQDNVFKPGKYILKLKAKKMNKAWCGYSFVLRDKDKKQLKAKSLTGYYGMKATNPEWTQFEFQIEIPENCTGRDYLNLGVQGGNVMIDDVQLIKVEPETAKK